MNRQKQYESSGSMIRFFLKGSFRIFLAGMLFAAAVSFLDMVLPRIISFTVDSVIGTRAADLPAPALSLLERIGGVETFRKSPWLIAAVILTVAFTAACFRVLFRYCNGRGAERFVKRIRDLLYHKLAHLPYSWYGENRTGDIIQRCSSDVETIKVFVSQQLTSLIRVVVLIALAVVFMAEVSPAMTAAASLFIPVMIGYSLFFYSRIGSAFQKADEEEGKLSAIAQENLTGVRVVRAFGREQFERSRFGEQNRIYTAFWIRLMKILSLNWIAGDILTLLQYLLVTVMGSVFCVRGAITPGQFIAFVSYNSMLTWPVRSLGRVISEMSKAGISMERIRYIMNEAEEAGPAEALCPPLDRDICFDHVSFAYPGSAAWSLRDVSFTIHAGETFGILGGTGSGKSTLMYLLEKLYPVAEGNGCIRIGDTDIARIDTAWLRGGIGMVLQEPFLFSRSLAENIGIAAEGEQEEEYISGRRKTEETAGPGGQGRPSRTAAYSEKIRNAARTADILETAERFPAGFDTFVGERGVTLSGGQKQRTAIAQMLIRNCPVMIFDDSLSAVDTETDLKIREALRNETAGATVILIAHRITTLMQADRILVMEDGKAAEIGTHEELLKLGGIYRRVYDLQMAGKEQADD